ncbi:MAG TPA: NAD(P)/FAD-dependent oxidoreductase, partial [Edaphobacter sp.]|nr:NAD(P)/FAD-dependent oxidoreductase [Edaphobacter sp.]
QDRIGGRICTVERNGYRIEAGAEFIHGRAPEIFELVERFGLKTTEVEGETYCNLGDGLKVCDFFEEVDQVFDKLKRYTGPDKSFEEFVRESCEQESTRQWARGYVAGFHGAPPELAGVAGLIDDTLAEERIDGERSWRIHAGYGALVDAMWQCCERQGVLLRTSSPVTAVRWADAIEVECGSESYRARRAIVTLPLSDLQAASVTFDPPLTAKQKPLQQLAMGTVARCTLVFKRPFWRELHGLDGHELGDVSFMFSRGEDFPTWWTQAPADVPILTAWASSITALGLTGQPNDVVTDRALQSLQAITGITMESLKQEFVSAVWHDWHSNPWVRGAYS